MVQHALRKKCHGGRLLIEDEDMLKAGQEVSLFARGMGPELSSYLSKSPAFQGTPL